jgi:hypothetical protein
MPEVLEGWGLSPLNPFWPVCHIISVHHFPDSALLLKSTLHALPTLQASTVLQPFQSVQLAAWALKASWLRSTAPHLARWLRRPPYHMCLRGLQQLRRQQQQILMMSASCPEPPPPAGLLVACSVPRYIRLRWGASARLGKACWVQWHPEARRGCTTP